MPATDSICIVDDDPSVLHSVQRLLDSDGLDARTFDDPEKFLTHAHEHAVPLAVLDVWMPQIDGLQVQTRLHDFSPNTRVIVMTGRDEPATRAAALEAGALAYLVKPFDDETFLRVVREALGHAA